MEERRFGSTGFPSFVHLDMSLGEEAEKDPGKTGILKHGSGEATSVSASLDNATGVRFVCSWVGRVSK